jgi:hypothetical protein
MSQANRIREFTLDRYITLAFAAGLDEITIRAGESTERWALRTQCPRCAVHSEAVSLTNTPILPAALWSVRQTAQTFSRCQNKLMQGVKNPAAHGRRLLVAHQAANNWNGRDLACVGFEGLFANGHPKRISRNPMFRRKGPWVQAVGARSDGHAHGSRAPALVCRCAGRAAPRKIIRNVRGCRRQPEAARRCGGMPTAFITTATAGSTTFLWSRP